MQRSAKLFSVGMSKIFTRAHELGLDVHWESTKHGSMHWLRHFWDIESKTVFPFGDISSDLLSLDPDPVHVLSGFWSPSRIPSSETLG